MVQQIIEDAIARHPSIFASRTEVLHHMFVVLGCGYEWMNGELVYDCSGDEVDKIDRAKARKLSYKRTRLVDPYPWSDLCNLNKIPADVRPEWKEAAEEIRSELKSQKYKFAY